MGESKRRKQLDPTYGQISRKVYERPRLFSPEACRGSSTSREFRRMKRLIKANNPNLHYRAPSEEG